MGRANRRSILGQQIAEILGTANSSGNSRSIFRAAATKSLVCGSVALLVIAPAQVQAVGLGEISVQSNLGRPLQAVVPLRVGKGETLPADCVKPGARGSELRSPADLLVRSPAVTQPGTYNLRISTPGSLHEPMYELSLVINCPGTPVLVRHYVLMLDLPGTLASVAAVEAAKPPTNASRPPQVANSVVEGGKSASTTNDAPGARSYAAGTAARPDPMRSLESSAAPIQAGTLYRIRQGDTLSTIAARIDGRLPDTTWAVAEQLFTTNPDAFIRNNPDLIKLGSLIRIPGTAELASISPISSGRLTPQPAPAEPEPAPVPLPSVKTPAVAALRAEAGSYDASLGINQPAELVLESDLVPVEITSDRYQEIITANPVSDNVPNTAADPIEVTTPELEGFADNTVSNPFADEASANIPVNIDAKQPATQAPDVSVAMPASDKISPWLAIGVGLLLGLAISLILLRKRLVAAILSLFPGRDHADAFATKMSKSPSAVKASHSKTKSNIAGEFDTHAADAAFDTGAGQVSSAPPLKIGDPLEKTYIVESFEHEPTQEIGERPLETTDTSLQEKLDASLDPVALSQAGKSDDEMLAEIFEEIPADAFDADGTGRLEPTAQLPKTPEEEVFDPSGELPLHFASDVIDPTTDMPMDPTADIDRTLMQAFTEELEQIDPGLFEGSAQIDGAAELSESEQITSQAAEETSLDALPKSSDEDDILSETLYDALTLLERDYEDEFTASQILERSAIKKSLATLDGENDIDDEAIKRKLTG